MTTTLLFNYIKPNFTKVTLKYKLNAASDWTGLLQNKKYWLKHLRPLCKFKTLGNMLKCRIQGMLQSLDLCASHASLRILIDDWLKPDYVETDCVTMFSQ